MKPPLSILITSLNEQGETNRTIASIRETAGDKVQIVVVDDCSQIPLTLSDKDAVLIRNSDRLGVGGSRHLAATYAESDHIFIIDAHCRFEAGWLKTVLARVKDRPYTLHCCQCVGLSAGMMDMARSASYYFGGTFHFYGPDPNSPKDIQIMAVKWAKEQPGDDYELAAAIGACYIMPTDWFFHIGGLRILRGWLGDEEMLSLRTWLAGGEIRMLKSVRVGHMFREASPYKTPHWNLEYNRMAAILTCLPHSEAHRLLAKFGHDQATITARQRIAEDANLIVTEAAYLRRIFVREFRWYLEKFGIGFEV